MLLRSALRELPFRLLADKAGIRMGQAGRYSGRKDCPARARGPGGRCEPGPPSGQAGGRESAPPSGSVRGERPERKFRDRPPGTALLRALHQPGGCDPGQDGQVRLDRPGRCLEHAGRMADPDREMRDSLAVRAPVGRPAGKGSPYRRDECAERGGRLGLPPSPGWPGTNRQRSAPLVSARAPRSRSAAAGARLAASALYRA